MVDRSTRQSVDIGPLGGWSSGSDGRDDWAGHRGAAPRLGRHRRERGGVTPPRHQQNPGQRATAQRAQQHAQRHKHSKAASPPPPAPGPALCPDLVLSTTASTVAQAVAELLGGCR